MRHLMSLSKNELRKQLQTIRKAISETEQQSAAQKLCDLACQQSFFKAASKIAVYWPHDGEIDTHLLLNSILEQDKHCYLPVLCLKNRQTLAFAEYTRETPLIKNRYGIPEPEIVYATPIEMDSLDLIFVPLLGFDSQGRRLGRGGGFYDATFAELRRLHPKKWPKIVGLAYACQQVATIPIDKWDWHLDAVITEQQLLTFTQDLK